MSGEAVTDCRQVRRYLDDLGAALAFLPLAMARELHGQIAAHLEDALSSGASEEDVEFVLAQLGSPDDVAAAARAGCAGYRQVPWRSRLRLLRPGRSVIPVIAVVLVLAAYFAWQHVLVSTPPLTRAGAASWYFSQDARTARSTSADDHSQTAVLIRYGQMQGIAVLISNPGDRTQTVLGSAYYSLMGGPVHVAVATRGQIPAAGFRTARYALPGVIPPHQRRWLRFLWRSVACDEPGGGVETDTLQLKVRVGWVTRTETISLGQGYELAGRRGPGCP